MMNSYAEQEPFDGGTHMSTEYNRITRILLSICQEEDFLLKKDAYSTYKELLIERYFPNDEVMQQAILNNYEEEELVDFAVWGYFF